MSAVALSTRLNRFAAEGPESDRGKRALHHVRRSQMLPMGRREVVEGEHPLPVVLKYP